ncbi:MAG: hypothetical protein KJ970_18120 [Candidatus Eisenbacteria bacterium]|uniref:Uncharacterized protein n=1 Tax=Eiseniibacteriota bacterium TaxID=2212470 RepID=A0A948S2Y6_UNCEI|nr:hypothetical protein [Candidatus Eisenbacteria bacterium]MBU1948255.1 hypothetical protein [Candidatus Eisenbacteria bacterium]MBU2692839.1 hypothetical protein [Candidatus Eisenbacteria bacterium]
MKRPKDFWRTLEAFPGAAAVSIEWKVRCGVDYGAAQSFLRPNGKLALSYPCTIPRGCGCQHDVITHATDDIVAVCRCERGCETFPLQQSDVVIYELDRPALGAALVNLLGLFNGTDTETDLHGTTCIGVYSPYAGYRFPVYLTIQIEPSDFNEIVDGLLVRNNTPFVLLAPTRDLCTAKAEKLLIDKGSVFVPLSENVILGDKRELRLLRPLDEILAQFLATNLPSPKEDGSKVFFPTPPDATWRDVSIKFIDGHTVSITVKSVGGVYNYIQMGMVDRRNSGPTQQWKLLRAFSERCGNMTWDHPAADLGNIKRRERLAAKLSAFFRIEGEPFRLTHDRKGWQARFSISPR